MSEAVNAGEILKATQNLQLKLDEAYDILENFIMAYELPGNHCEMTDTILQARKFLGYDN